MSSAVTLIDVRQWLNGLADGRFSTFVRANGDPILVVIDPGNGSELVALNTSTVEDVAVAVAAARTAFDEGEWPRSAPEVRARALYRLADLVERDLDFLATIEALDTGKPLSEAIFDIQEVAMVLRYYAGWADKVTGQTIPSSSGVLAFTLREPIGVCAAITPWNYPLPILMYKLAPALATGNTFVAKPSENAPLSSIYFMELCQEAGIPDGVVSLVLGSGDVGSELCSNQNLDKIAFTGSTKTGQAIMAAAAKTGTKVSLELGGKSPQVVFESADIDKAVAGVAAGIWINAGQVCVAGSRLIVQNSVKDLFLSKLAEYGSGLKLGHSLEQDSTMGPIISSNQLSNIEKTLQAAEHAGGSIIRLGSTLPAQGYFLSPTIIEGLDARHSIHQEEIFGPVLSVLGFDTEDQAIELANSTRYGLAAGVWTSNAGQAARLARAIKSGTVWVNSYGVFHPTLPFGGTKSSGFGRELGASAIEGYTEIKTVYHDIER